MKHYLLLLLLFCCSTAYAEEPIINIYHVAGVTCGKYINDTSSNQQAKEVFSWWLAGFLSAINMERGRVTTTDKYANELWIDNYCKANPLNLYFNAAVMLDKKLSEHAGN